MAMLSNDQKAYLDDRLESCKYCYQLVHAIIEMPLTYHPPYPDKWTEAAIDYLKSKQNLPTDQQNLVDKLE